MPFIQDILQNKSVSIVGMAKNTGKTTCLNYVLNRLEECNSNVAVTSIGVDGEERDVLYDTPKPRIYLKKGNYFITSEKHFAERELQAKVLSVSHKMTALGRLIVAQVEQEGKVILSGPSDSNWLYECINSMSEFNVDITVVDGALSRMSLASPAITDAMILCTGATCAIQLDQLIKKVKFICELINISQAEEQICNLCQPIQEGVWVLSNDIKSITKVTNSLFVDDNNIFNLIAEHNYFFVNGALTDNFLKLLTASGNVANKHFIVRDFTKIFVQPATYKRFIRRGGDIQVLQKAKLLALCTNPTSPEGYHYNAEVLRSSIQDAVQLPVYDIMQILHKKQNS